MVATATDGERQHIVAGVRNASNHVGYVGAPHNREWVTIHCAVMDGTRRVVLRIRSGDDLASDSGKIINSYLVAGCSACCCHEDQHSPA